MPSYSSHFSMLFCWLMIQFGEPPCLTSAKTKSLHDTVGTKSHNFCNISCFNIKKWRHKTPESSRHHTENVRHHSDPTIMLCSTLIMKSASKNLLVFLGAKNVERNLTANWHMRDMLCVTYLRKNDHSSVNTVLEDLCIKEILELMWEVIFQILKNMLLRATHVERSKFC